MIRKSQLIKYLGIGIICFGCIVIGKNASSISKLYFNISDSIPMQPLTSLVLNVLVGFIILISGIMIYKNSLKSLKVSIVLIIIAGIFTIYQAIITFMINIQAYKTLVAIAKDSDNIHENKFSLLTRGILTNLIAILIIVILLIFIIKRIRKELHTQNTNKHIDYKEFI